MTERFVFRPNPSLGAVVGALESPRGHAFVRETISEFSSLVDLLHNTVSYQGSTFVHEPDGTNVQFVNVPKQEFAHATSIATRGTGFNVY